MTTLKVISETILLVISIGLIVLTSESIHIKKINIFG